MKRFFALTVLLLSVLGIYSQEESAKIYQVSIIPQPQQISFYKGYYTLPGSVIIALPDTSDESMFTGGFLREKLELFYGIRAKIRYKASGDIVFILLPNYDTLIGKEGYYLSIDTNIIIRANTNAGLFYGMETLLQLLPPEVFGQNTVKQDPALPKLRIVDYPRFTYRGMHLDVSRHFFPVDSIKQYIDLLAMHKMNTFHWHLTDDQGWRIEIKKYPQLTKIGAWRKETIVDKHFKPYIGDGQPYGGYYTQDEIKDIVHYASLRHITIIPEIEMPGHSMAALASYPYLGCTGGPYEVATRWGVFHDVYCAGNDSVFTFLEDVLAEVMDLFPSRYIHIGGDEVPKDRWHNCPKCQARIQEEGLKDERELQSYFIRRIEKFLNAHGRNIIGWDEILEGGLAPNATVMSWRGEKGGIQAARMHHYVVMTPVSYCYFDYYQANPQTEPLAIGGYTPLSKVYSYDPVPEDISPQEAKYILGAQGNVWTEYMPSFRHVQYMALPRMSALSEVLWTLPGKKDWQDFTRRIEIEFKRLDQLGVNYCDHYE